MIKNSLPYEPAESGTYAGDAGGGYVAPVGAAVVTGFAGSSNPIMDSAAAPGASVQYARIDHVHPTDTSRMSQVASSLGYLHDDGAGVRVWRTITSSDVTTALGFTPSPSTRTISTTAPLTGGGDLSANRTLAMAAAASGVPGYLTAADWATFNGKYTPGTALSATTGNFSGVITEVNAALTSTTLRANVVANLQSNTNGGDVTLLLSDGQANNYHISGNGGNLYFSAGGVSAATILTLFNGGNATLVGMFTSASLKNAPVAFASLPSGSAGMRAFVNNNSAGAAFGSAANGSGAVTYPVYHDGTSWKIG